MPPVKLQLYKLKVKNWEKPFFIVSENAQQAKDDLVEKEDIKKEDIVFVEMIENYTSNDYKIAGIYGSRDEDDWF